MDNRKIARELVAVARDLMAGLVSDEWMDAFVDGATHFLVEAKSRGYVIERPEKFVGGVRFILDSAGGKDGVQVRISLFKPVNKPWFISVDGWVNGSIIRNVRKKFNEDIPSPKDIYRALDAIGKRAGFWRR